MKQILRRVFQLVFISIFMTHFVAALPQNLARLVEHRASRTLLTELHGLGRLGAHDVRSVIEQNLRAYEVAKSSKNQQGCVQALCDLKIALLNALGSVQFHAKPAWVTYEGIQALELEGSFLGFSSGDFGWMGKLAVGLGITAIVALLCKDKIKKFVSKSAHDGLNGFVTKFFGTDSAQEVLRAPLNELKKDIPDMAKKAMAGVLAAMNEDGGFRDDTKKMVADLAVVVGQGERLLKVLTPAQQARALAGFIFGEDPVVVARKEATAAATAVTEIKKRVADARKELAKQAKKIMDAENNAKKLTKQNDKDKHVTNITKMNEALGTKRQELVDLEIEEKKLISVAERCRLHAAEVQAAAAGQEAVKNQVDADADSDADDSGNDGTTAETMPLVNMNNGSGVGNKESVAGGGARASSDTKLVAGSDDDV